MPSFSLAVFSDIHANLPALEAVLQDIEQRPVDAWFCLGDLVGYGPWPNEVIERIRSLRIPTIAGDHDIRVATGHPPWGYAFTSEQTRRWTEQAYAYTHATLTPENRAYLHQLPRHMRLSFGPEDLPLQLLMVHGSPRRQDEYLYKTCSDRTLHRVMDLSDADVLVFGHTHQQYHRQLPAPTSLPCSTRHVINVGAVGRPNGNDVRAHYALIHLSTLPGMRCNVQVDFIAVPYDVEQVIHTIKNSPLPSAYALDFEQSANYSLSS